MTTDYRALCAELVEQVQRAINDHGLCLDASDALMHRARAALAARQQRAPSKEAIHALADKILDGDRSSHVDFARAVLTRYGAQAVPVAPSNICSGCNTPRHEAIAYIANGAMACCPDCSTLTVEDRNAIRAIKAVPVAVAERLPGADDLDQNAYCWLWDSDGWEYRNSIPVMPEGTCYHTHWLPHWALPLPQAEVGS